ncbi:LolA family protein [Halostagnicola bangensis]
MHRRRLITAGATVALAGCFETDSSEGDPASDELVQEAIDARAEIDDLAAVRTMTAETPEETVERTERLYQRPPDAQRKEVLESTDSRAPTGTVSVRNQAVTWGYDPTMDRVLERHHPNRIVADRTRLVLETLLEDYELAYDGTDAVDDRETHVVDATPKSDDELERSIELLVGETIYVIPLGMADDGEIDEAEVVRTIWIDDEHRYPIKERTLVETDETTLHSLTVTYDELEINEGLEDGTFTYDPPEDANVESVGMEPVGVYESPAAAEAVVPYELPEPDVPEAFDLDRITVLDKSFSTTATSWYVDTSTAERELFVAVRESSRHNEDVLEPIEIDGHEAYLRDGNIESIFWECEELSFEVSSPHIGEPLEDIASSIGCP